MAFSFSGERVYVAGHRGMVGSAVVRRLQSENCEILTVTHKNVDLRMQDQTQAWMQANRPTAVLVAAATVGGIHANDTRPGEFIYDNIMIAGNVIEASRRVGVKKLLFLGSSCIYPRMAPQPMSEDALLTGPPEPTNQWYGIAKIAGLKMCEAYRLQYGCDYISAQPTNLYGPSDNYDLRGSHVIPALLSKFHTAKMTHAPEVEVWGTGTPRREFLHVDDLADALVFLMKNYSEQQQVNVGWGREITIAELVTVIAEVVGYGGKVRYNTDYPDGTPRKLLDIAKIKKLGWEPKISLREGLAHAYAWYVENAAEKA
ncbi:MAG: GDP-L-fucose synthase [Alphaproteobacteria bacterium]